MRKFVLILICLISYVVSNAQKTYVLSVGVSVYTNQTKNLSKTSNDAKTFANIMNNYTPNVIILTSKYATRDNILAKLDSICNIAEEEDRILFFFSGHGTNGYLLAHDDMFVGYNEIRRRLNSSKSNEKFVFVDACFSGSISDNYRKTDAEFKSNDGIFYFMSSSAQETSLETNMLDNGYFSQALLTGLKMGADYNDDNQITVKELHKYVFDRVKKMSHGRQHPQLICPKSKIENTVVITKNK